MEVAITYKNNNNNLTYNAHKLALVAIFHQVIAIVVVAHIFYIIIFVLTNVLQDIIILNSRLVHNVILLVQLVMLQDHKIAKHAMEPCFCIKILV